MYVIAVESMRNFGAEKQRHYITWEAYFLTLGSTALFAGPAECILFVLRVCVESWLLVYFLANGSEDFALLPDGLVFVSSVSTGKDFFLWISSTCTALDQLFGISITAVLYTKLGLI